MVQELILHVMLSRRFRRTIVISTQLTYLFSSTMQLHLSWYLKEMRLLFYCWRSAEILISVLLCVFNLFMIVSRNSKDWLVSCFDFNILLRMTLTRLWMPFRHNMMPMTFYLSTTGQTESMDYWLYIVLMIRLRVEMSKKVDVFGSTWY
jgi:hypothetical protein